MTIDAARLVADLAYVEAAIASSTVLQATVHVVFTTDRGVSVEVQGAHWEARAWRAVFAGRIMPSSIGSDRVRRQLIIAHRVEIQVVDRTGRGA